MNERSLLFLFLFLTIFASSAHTADLPRAHKVVYLDLPPADAAKAMSTDGSRAALDIHETAGNDYKAAVRETFLWCAEHHDHWVRVPCVDDEGGRYSKAELGEVLYARLAGEFVNKKDEVMDEVVEAK